jgi:N-acetylmuramoyl-L-alanine amidase
MKKIVFILLITLLLLTSGVVYSKKLINKLEGKTIVIDPGHGGKDSGTLYKNILEKDINLSIALKLKKRFSKYNVEVMLTRNGDYDLSSPNATRRKKSDFDNRIKLINNSDADLYLSIHINYLGDSRYYGAQVFYVKGNEELASSIQREFNEYLKSPLKEKEMDASIYMYKKLDIQGVLIECGFISNDIERERLLSSEYQDRIVDSIIEGLINYYN